MNEDKGVVIVQYYDKEFAFTFDNDLDVYQFVEEVVAPMMISMGYSAANVWEALCMEEELEATKDYLNKEGVFSV